MKTGVTLFFAIPTAICFGAPQTPRPSPSPHAAPQTHAPKNAQPGVLATTDASGQPITTEIYADEATFDTEKRLGVFTGHVRVFDPRFNIQSDKLTVYIHKQEGEGLEKAIAEGHVGVVRERADPQGGPTTKAIGLSEKAVYTSSNGDVVLTGSPRVQQGLDTHVATSPDTIMILNQDGHLQTHGPSRTEIRQQSSPTPSPSPGASRAASPSPSPAKKKR
jgi:lipopolysaccharide transport protein LptA